MLDGKVPGGMILVLRRRESTTDEKNSDKQTGFECCYDSGGAEASVVGVGMPTHKVFISGCWQGVADRCCFRNRHLRVDFRGLPGLA